MIYFKKVRLTVPILFTLTLMYLVFYDKLMTSRDKITAVTVSIGTDRLDQTV